MSSNRLRRQQLTASVACSLAAVAIAILCYGSGSLLWVDNLIEDLQVKLRGSAAPATQPVLVLMDEQSSVELGRTRGNWSRRHLTQALQNLCQAEAEIIGLDMLLAVPDPDPQIDLELAGTINRCNNVVLSRISSAPGVDDISPLPLFAEAMIGDGFIDLSLDKDEVLRRVRFLNAKPLAGDQLLLLPSFSLELVRAYLDLDFQFDFSHPDHFLLGAAEEQRLRLPHPELLIDFSGNFQRFPQLSFADIVKGRFAPEAVAGKIVLLGSSLAIQKDFWVTPYSRFQKPPAEYQELFGTVVDRISRNQEPGVAVHAYAVETMLAQSFLTRLEPGMTILCLLLLGGLGSLFYLPALKTRYQLLLLLLLLGTVATAGYLAFLRHSLLVGSGPLQLLLLLQFSFGTSLQRIFEKRRTEQVSRLFGRYVSPRVANRLINEDISSTLSGHRQEVTVFFSDIRSFTSLSERLGAKQTADLLNGYFSQMIPLIFQHEGTLDKLIGDAIMAFFGAPLTFAGHADQAAEASLAMLETLEELRSRQLPGIDQLAIGIGLNTGEVTVGNLGSETFMDYTVIGDTVNLASRLEGLNKVYGTRILLSEHTVAQLSERFVVRRLDRVLAKGKDRAVTIFELMGIRERLGEAQLQAAGHFEAARQSYLQRDWDSAEEQLQQVLQRLPEDGPAQLYLQRIGELRLQPPAEDWQGVTRFETK